MLTTLQAEDTVAVYLPTLGKGMKWLYGVLIGLIMGALLILPLVQVDVSVRAAGIIRPVAERTEIRALVPGIIDSIYCREGGAIVKNDICFRLRDQDTWPKRVQNDYELAQRERFIKDLVTLTTRPVTLKGAANRLQSPLYRQQYFRFAYQLSEQQAALKKARQELATSIFLSNEKVIAPKELFDKNIEMEKMEAAYRSFINQQLSVWQEDLEKYRLELSVLRSQQYQVNRDSGLYLVKAPVSGTVQGVNNRYAGNVLQAGETICLVSPEATLVAECLVSPLDIGLIRTGQPVSFSIDAFDQHYFGRLAGRVMAIDNDFSIRDNKPFFKLYCSFDTSVLRLRNGFRGNLKKGITLQASFVIARRNLWQLLFDRVDDWFNPSLIRQ